MKTSEALFFPLIFMVVYFILDIARQLFTSSFEGVDVLVSDRPIQLVLKSIGIILQIVLICFIALIMIGNGEDLGRFEIFAYVITSFGIIVNLFFITDIEDHVYQRLAWRSLITATAVAMSTALLMANFPLALYIESYIKDPKP